MTPAVELLSELEQRGVVVVVEGDTICLRPKRALDEILIARVREARAAILEALRELPGDVFARLLRGCTWGLDPPALGRLFDKQIGSETALCRESAIERDAVNGL